MFASQTLRSNFKTNWGWRLWNFGASHFSFRNPVPETVLKARKATQELALSKEEQAKKREQKRKTRQEEAFKRAEKYVQEYRAQRKELVTLRRQAKAKGNFFVEPEAKLAFVIRIRGINGLHPKPRKALQLLRLRQINNGVFVKLNGATLQMLKIVEPYIAWGTPSLKTVRELLYKRGYLRIKSQRKAITDNELIEETLGKQGIICLEDLVHEIYTVGPHFKTVNKSLWPFKLHPPKGGFNKVLKHFNEGGDFGNRENAINDLIERMN